MTKSSLAKLNNSIKGFVNTVHVDELLCYNKDTKEMVVAGKPLAPEVASQIRSEMETLKKGLLWQFLVKDVVYAQNKVMAERATSLDDIIFNRAVKFNLKVLTDTINVWDGINNPPPEPEKV